jgi:hypothetical protein
LFIGVLVVVLTVPLIVSLVCLTLRVPMLLSNHLIFPFVYDIAKAKELPAAPML